MEKVARCTVEKGVGGPSVSRAKVTAVKPMSLINARLIVAATTNTLSPPEAKEVPLSWKRHQVAIKLGSSDQAPRVSGYLNEAVKVLGFLGLRLTTCVAGPSGSNPLIDVASSSGSNRVDSELAPPRSVRVLWPRLWGCDDAEQDPWSLWSHAF